MGKIVQTAAPSNDGKSAKPFIAKLLHILTANVRANSALIAGP
jgi:hypothetical protein